MGVVVCPGQLDVSSFPSIKTTMEGKVIQRTIHLDRVAQSDLHKTFICFAQNSLGNTTQPLQLKGKKGGTPGTGPPPDGSGFP